MFVQLTDASLQTKATQLFFKPNIASQMQFIPERMFE